MIIRIRRIHNSIALHELFQITRTTNGKVENKAVFTKPFLNNGYENQNIYIKIFN